MYEKEFIHLETRELIAFQELGKKKKTPPHKNQLISLTC